MTQTTEPPKDSGQYRLSDKFIKLWTRILVTFLCVGLGIGLGIFVYALIVYGDVPADELPGWVIPTATTISVIGLAVPLILGAILGGISIHPLGWLPLLLLVLGLMGTGAAVIPEIGIPNLMMYSIIAMVVGGVGIFLLAIFKSKVDIWFGLPILNSPRWYVRGKRRDGEDDPSEDEPNKK